MQKFERDTKITNYVQAMFDTARAAPNYRFCSREPSPIHCLARAPFDHPGLLCEGHLYQQLVSPLAPIAEPLRRLYNAIADEVHQYIPDLHR